MAVAKNNVYRQWMLLNKKVGSKCLALLMGMGYNRLHNAFTGRVDLRYNAFGFASSLKFHWSSLFNYVQFTFIKTKLPVVRCIIHELGRAYIWWVNEDNEGSPLFFRGTEVRRTRAVKRMRVDQHLMKLYLNAAGMLPTKLLGCTNEAFGLLGINVFVTPPNEVSAGWPEGFSWEEHFASSDGSFTRCGGGGGGGVLLGPNSIRKKGREPNTVIYHDLTGLAWGSDDDTCQNDDFCVDGERLEDDEALRLHILGCNSTYTKFLSIFKVHFVMFPPSLA